MHVPFLSLSALEEALLANRRFVFQPLLERADKALGDTIGLRPVSSNEHVDELFTPYKCLEDVGFEMGAPIRNQITRPGWQQHAQRFHDHVGSHVRSGHRQRQTQALTGVIVDADQHCRLDCPRMLCCVSKKSDRLAGERIAGEKPVRYLGCSGVAGAETVREERRGCQGKDKRKSGKCGLDDFSIQIRKETEKCIARLR